MSPTIIPTIIPTIASPGPVSVSWGDSASEGDAGDAWWGTVPASTLTALIADLEHLRSRIRVDVDVVDGVSITVLGASDSLIDDVNDRVVALIGEPDGVC